MAEEMRGKETRERERDNKNRNGKQRGDYDVLGSRKQERFVNLEKMAARRNHSSSHSQNRKKRLSRHWSFRRNLPSKILLTR